LQHEATPVFFFGVADAVCVVVADCVPDLLCVAALFCDAFEFCDEFEFCAAIVAEEQTNVAAQRAVIANTLIVFI